MCPMSNNTAALRAKEWNPYLVGAGIGVLSWLVFWLVDKPLGMSTAVAQISGAVVGTFSDNEFAYWQKYKPAFDYGMIFLIATIIGTTISSLLSGNFKIETVPELWRKRFGNSVLLRMIVAFIGGFVLLFGARLAGGCTSGHGISGTLQLATSGWLFFAALLVTGLITAHLMFRSND